MKSNNKTLFGLSVGDEVKYIANNEKDYGRSVHSKIGKIVNINYYTTEFYVQFNLSVTYCFYRYELLRIGEKPDDIVYKKSLLDSKSMSIGEMRNYLTTYHSFIEGKDFSICEKEDFKEVFLKTEKYAQLVDDLITIQKATEKLSDAKIGLDITTKLKSEIINNACLTLFFQQSDWIFRTSVSYLLMYESILKYYGVDLNDK